MRLNAAMDIDAVWAVLDELSDPEIPVLSLRDLGIVRDVHVAADGVTEVVITPTYSGCPAISQIEDDVRAALQQHRIAARVVTKLSPAWTTDWMSESGKEKLRQYGIAPPGRCAGGADAGGAAGTQVLRFIGRAGAPEMVPCPRCGSGQTVETSRFASTACKALYKCLACQEPFDYFKPY